MHCGIVSNRLWQKIVVINRNIATIKRNRTKELAKLITRSYYLNKRGKSDEMYHGIYETFMKLGGVYVKFLQGVMLRTEAMKRWQNTDRLDVFEDLASENLDIQAILRQQLGSKASQIVSLQPEPFAAGSFGQVYYGQHVDGNMIIVKALRPMTNELLRSDLKLLSLFAKRFYNSMIPNMDMDFRQAVKDFTSATLRETDYKSEVAFANELYNYYQGHPKMVIPKTYSDLSTNNIIVQQYMNGLSVAKLIRLQQQGADPVLHVSETLGSDLDAQLVTLGIESLGGMFYLPRIQGDPHPGNIRLLPGNKIGMIDFGMFATTPSNKSAFFGLIKEWNNMYSNDVRIPQLFEQFIRFFVTDLYLALKKVSSMNLKSMTGQHNITEHVGKLAQNTFNLQVKQNDIEALLENGKILQIMNQIVNKDNRFGLIMKLDASEIMRSAQTYMALIETLGRRSAVLPVVFQEVVKKIDHDFPGLDHQQEKSMSANQALDVISNWLERIAERDPTLFKQIMSRRH